jgi:hypothetical protein
LLRFVGFVPNQTSCKLGECDVLTISDCSAIARQYPLKKSGGRCSAIGSRIFSAAKSEAEAMTKKDLITAPVILVAIIYGAYSFLAAEFERSNAVSNAQEHIRLAQGLIAGNQPPLSKPVEDAINLAIESLQTHLNLGDGTTTEGIRSRDAALMSFVTLLLNQQNPQRIGVESGRSSID